MKKASSIYILTSFVMYSGVRLLEPHLKEAIELGAEVKVLAGDYLFVTQPHALQSDTSTRTSSLEIQVEHQQSPEAAESTCSETAF